MTKENNIHDFMVENDLRYHFETNNSLFNQSCFIKKVTNEDKFLVNKVYLGTRTCHSDFYHSIEETLAFYVSSIDEEKAILSGFVVYYELKPENADKYFIEKYYPPYNETIHNIVKNGFSSISVKLRKYKDSDLEFNDDIAINITSKNEAELKGWWFDNTNL